MYPQDVLADIGVVYQASEFCAYQRSSSDFVHSPSRQVGERSNYVYFSASTDSETSFPFNAASKLDVQTGKVTEWVAPKGEAVGEAFFVPRNDGDNNVSDDDDGY